jgi:hypothetical protein
MLSHQFVLHHVQGSLHGPVGRVLLFCPIGPQFKSWQGNEKEEEIFNFSLLALSLDFVLQSYLAFNHDKL